MTDREKLIKLLREVQYLGGLEENIADHLIANGVTVAYNLSPTEPLTNCQQWIPVTERYPEKKGEYLVTYHPCYWDDVKKEILVGIDSFRGKTTWSKKKFQRVTHWMPLPQPPKGE